MVTVGRDHGYKLRVVITVVPSENDDIARRGDRLAAAGCEEVRPQAFIVVRPGRFGRAIPTRPIFAQIEFPLLRGIDN